MLITDILTRNVNEYGDEIALIEREPEKNIRREITWKKFDENASRLANALARRGIARGDSVIQLMMNSLEWLPVYFGILKNGSWVVPLNFRFLAEKIKHCAQISEAKVFIFGEEFIDRIEEIKSTLDKTVTHYIFVGPLDRKPEYAEYYEDVIASEPDDRPSVDLHMDDGAALYFTSGTTGDPKAVLLTHKNLEFVVRVENRHHQQKHEDNFLCIPPLYHTGAKMHWFGNFMVGARSVILKGVSPRWIMEAISEEKATIVWLLVPWAHDILLAIERGEIRLEDYELDQWRLMHIGAQPVPPSLIEKWKKIFPHHEYDTNYGLTEASGPGCIHLGMGNTHKVGAIGIPGYGWQCLIVDRNMETVPVGEPGEVLVRGDGMMKEYYKNPVETAGVIVNGWLKTGDIGREDMDGFIWLLDRKKDVIITGGENIFPVEVENVLIKNEKIQDVAVIGLPDDRLGEIVAAVIQLKPGAAMTEDEVNEYCLKMPRYRRPRKVFFDDVPRNPTGKIEKPKLRKKFAGIYSSFRR